MSLKLQPNPTFPAVVNITVHGQEKLAKVTVTYKHLSRPKLKEFFENVEGKPFDEILPEVIVSWEGCDEPYSHESLTRLLDNYPASGAELFDGFRKNSMESRAKNL